MAAMAPGTPNAIPTPSAILLVPASGLTTGMMVVYVETWLFLLLVVTTLTVENAVIIDLN